LTDDTTNWNTGYGWGNHASAGYATKANIRDTILADTSIFLASLIRLGKVTDDTTALIAAKDSVAAWDNAGIGTANITDQTITKSDIDTTSSNIPFNNAYKGTTAQAESILVTHGEISKLTDDSTALIASKDSVAVWDNLGYPKATTTTLGIASFATANFGVTTGAVTIKTDGVTATEIATSGVATAEILDQTITKSDIDTTSSNIPFNDAYRATTATADSLLATMGYVKIKEIQCTFALPKNLYDSLAVWPIWQFSAAATIDSLRISTDNSSTYSVIFEEWSVPQTETNDIDTIATSGSYTQGGVPSDASMAAGSYLKVRLPATTGVKALTVRVKYHY
jgi:hypothetical protein